MSKILRRSLASVVFPDELGPQSPTIVVELPGIEYLVELSLICRTFDTRLRTSHMAAARNGWKMYDKGIVG